jgi:hypothetical protein
MDNPNQAIDKRRESSATVEITELRFKRDARVTVMFTEPMKLTLQQLAAALGWDLSDLVREAVRIYVNSQHPDWFHAIYKHNIEEIQNRR